MNYSQAIIETLRSLKPELARKYSVNTIGVFGSVLRSDYSPAKSDIDIIVDFSGPIGIEFIDLADFLELKIKRKIDLVSKNGIKKKYFQQIEKSILYA